LLLPSVEGLPGYPNLADQIRDRQAQLGPLQYRHDLLNRKPLPLHRRISSHKEIRRKY
jgi:hypothetical protein